MSDSKKLCQISFYTLPSHPVVDLDPMDFLESRATKPPDL